MFRKLRIGVSILTIGAVGFLFSTVPTYAANYHYDGKNPVSTHCDDTGVVKKKKRFNKAGVSGVTMLMYSTKCKTAWAYVKLDKPLKYNQDTVIASVHRNNDKKTYHCNSAGGNGGVNKGQKTCYSAMVYDYKPNTSYAESVYISGGYVAKLGKTSSY
jgi:hypothetical protein